MSADFRIRLWLTNNDHLTLDYATLRAHYAESGERILDRRGLLHRIAPPGHRYPVALSLALLPEELTRLSASTAPVQRSALEWLDLHFRAQSELLLYCSGAGYTSRQESWGLDAAENSLPAPALSRNLAYRVFIDSLPPEVGGSLGQILTAASGLGNDGLLELGLHVSEDGLFTDFDSLSSYSAFDPPR
jgi:hypothetical protein